MKKIDIAAILSPDLKSRMRAKDLKALIENSGADVVEMDFQGVTVWSSIMSLLTSKPC